MSFVLASTLLEWISVGIVVLLCVYWYFLNVYNFWKKKGIKFVDPVIPFGNSKKLLFMRQSLAEFLKEMYDTFPEERYLGLYEFTKPALLIRDPQLIRDILVKDFAYFHDRGIVIDEKLDPLNAHLAFLNGARWKNLRAKLTPAFSSGKIKTMFHLMLECAEHLVQFLDKPATNEEMLEMKSIVTRYTMDIIGSCVFGLQFNAIASDNSEFRKVGKRMFEPSVRDSLVRLARTAFPSMLTLFRIKTMPQELTDFFIGAVHKTIEYRKENNFVRNDFMQLLIQLKNKGKIEQEGDICREQQDMDKGADIEFTDSLLAAQAFIFFLAGFETSSTTVSFCLYELALNPAIQDKLRGSIQSIVKRYDGKVTYDSLQDMSYLDQVVDETLRIYPPSSLLSRQVTKPYTIPGTSLQLDVGLKVLISQYGLHLDPKYFPEPKRFNPENFSSDAKATRPHYAYLPFGAGPRNCIGMKFGLVELKLCLVVLLLNYKFSVCEKTEIPIRLDPKQFVTSSTTGAWLRIKKCTSS